MCVKSPLLAAQMMCNFLAEYLPKCCCVEWWRQHTRSLALMHNENMTFGWRRGREKGGGEGGGGGREENWVLRKGGISNSSAAYPGIQICWLGERKGAVVREQVKCVRIAQGGNRGRKRQKKNRYSLNKISTKGLMERKINRTTKLQRGRNELNK